MSRSLELKAISILPRFIRKSLLRSRVQLPDSIPPQLKFKVAQNSCELDQCFRLYEKLNQILKVKRPNQSRFLPTVQHALPTTTHLIATWNGNVIATLSLVKDSEFGLPMEDFIDISYYKKRDHRIAEVLGLTIDEDFFADFYEKGYLFFYLKFVFEYCMKISKMNHLLMIIPHDYAALFEDVILAKPLPLVSKKQNMQNKNLYGKVFQISFNEKLIKDFQRNYSHLKNSKDLAHFLFQNQIGFNNFVFPVRKYFKSDDPVLGPDLLKKYFLQKTEIFENLDEQNKQYILMLYNQKQFSRITANKKVITRQHYRFKNQLFGKNQYGLPIDIKEVSRGGIRVLQSNYLKKQKEIIEFDIKISQTKQARIMAKIVWTNKDEVGLKILNACPEWDHYINYLENDLSNGQRFGEEIFTKAA